MNNYNASSFAVIQCSEVLVNSTGKLANLCTAGGLYLALQVIRPRSLDTSTVAGDIQWQVWATH